jgi:antitoxin HicB
VRFPRIPEALTEGETEEEARTSAVDCLIAALEGYVKAGGPVPRPSLPDPALDHVVLPPQVAAKLAVYETMQARGWSKARLAMELGVSESSVRLMLNLRRRSPVRIIEAALAKIDRELSIYRAGAQDSAG